MGRARVVHVRAWACESVMCVRACLGGAARHQGCALRVVAAALAELPDTSVPSSGSQILDPCVKVLGFPGEPWVCAHRKPVGWDVEESTRERAKERG